MVEVREIRGKGRGEYDINTVYSHMKFSNNNRIKYVYIIKIQIYKIV